MKRQKQFPFLALFFIVGFIVYGNSLQNKFLFDDIHLILDNVFVRSFNFAPYYFKGLLSSSASSPVMFRPLLMLTFNFNYLMNAYNVFGYHVLNITIHIFNAYVLYLILSLLFSSAHKGVLVFVGLIFLMHPLNVEAVSYLSSRSDLLSLLFILLCFLNFLFYEKNRIKKYMFFSSLFLCLSLLAKELAISMPVFIFIYLLKKYGLKIFKKEPILYLPYFVLTILYLLLRESLYGIIGMPDFSKNYYLSILTQSKAAFYYIRLFVFPHPLSIDHQTVRVSKAFDLWGQLALASIAGIAITLVLSSKRYFLSAIGIAWYLSFLLPKFLSTLYFAVMEHHFYIPSIGIYILLLPLFDALYKRGGKVFRYSAASILLSLWIITFFRNFDWKEQTSIWRSALRVNPCSMHGLKGAADAYMNKGLYDEALLYYSRLLEIKDDEIDTAKILIAISEAYRNQGKNSQAKELLMQASNINDKLPQLYRQLGLVYSSEGDFKKAQVYWEKEIELSSYSDKAYFNIGVLYFFEKLYSKAEYYFNKSLSYNPSLAGAYYFLGRIAEDEFRPQKAIVLYQKAVRFEPFSWEAHFALGTLYAKSLDNRAESELKKTIEINPAYPEAWYNLGLYYLDVQPARLSEARENIKKSEKLGVKIAPEIRDIIKNADR